MTRRSARHRAIKRMGRDVEVINYSWSGDTDEYGDPVNFSESSTTTSGLVERAQNPEQVQGPDGATVTADVEIHLPDDVEVEPAGDDDATKATRIRDANRDLEWKVYDVFEDGQGVLTALCRAQ